MFSDDDAIKDGAIDTIVKNLDKGYQYLEITISFYDKNLANEDLSQKVGPDVVYLKGDHDKALLATMSNGWSLMSKIITKKKFLDSKINSIPRDMFLPIVLPFMAIVDKSGKLIGSPLIRYRSDNVTWKDRMMEISLVEAPKSLQILSPWYSKETIRKATAYNLTSLVAIVNAQINYDPHKRFVYMGYVLKSHLSYSYKIVAWSVLALPKPVVDLTIKTFKRAGLG